MQDQYLLTRTSKLRGYRKTCACSQATHRAWIEPVAWFVDIDNSSAITDDIPAIAYNCCILIDKITYIAAQTHRMYRHSIRIHCCLITSQYISFFCSNVVKPIALAKLLRCRGQMTHTQPYITYQPDCRATVDANILTCKVEPDDIGSCWNKWGLS